MENELFITGHMGRKVEKIRKLRSMKQETLANAMGISRQSLSRLEQSEIIEDDKLEAIATALGMTTDNIKNFNEDSTVNYIQNNFEGSNKESSNVFVTNNHCNFNPLDKCMELIEKNEKLYQQLIETEREKNEILQRLLDKK